MDPDKDKMIEILKKLKSDGLSYRAIADRLTVDGIPTFSGRGKWHKGTVKNLLEKRSKDVKQAAIPLPVTDKKITEEKALSDKDLNENKSLKAEIARLREREEKQTERYRKLLTENNELRQEKIDMNVTTEQIIDAVKPLIDGLRGEIADLKQQITGIDISSLDREKPVTVEGWTLLQSSTDGFYRAYRQVNNKQRCLYIGKIDKFNKAALMQAGVKIRAGIKRKGADWGLSEEEITEMTGGEASPADETQDLRGQIIEIIRRNGGDSRTAAIWRCVTDAEQAGIDRETFRGVVDGLVSDMTVQLVQGDLNQTPENEREKLLWFDDITEVSYCNIVLT